MVAVAVAFSVAGGSAAALASVAAAVSAGSAATSTFLAAVASNLAAANPAYASVTAALPSGKAAARAALELLAILTLLCAPLYCCHRRRAAARQRARAAEKAAREAEEGRALKAAWGAAGGEDPAAPGSSGEPLFRDPNPLAATSAAEEEEARSLPGANFGEGGHGEALAPRPAPPTGLVVRNATLV